MWSSPLGRLDYAVNNAGMSGRGLGAPEPGWVITR
jgi:hypothetical protein